MRNEKLSFKNTNSVFFSFESHIETSNSTEATISNGKKEALKLLNLKDPPTAIFACNVLLAIGVIEAASEMGLHIPADLSHS
ncbi:hypothetical protein BKP45_10550 [Anaerobacillus alkalidiazotrophicus]|uniref:Transcriptional regulator LacI/GalR-like sensor domain-containing protein n=1 Tax=Anaerobacillus alkalidiazotrophicus TaxID=472963 RepID=A0A1S2M0E6_9BACI|nr:substrate-binding domain-containing protein [Anaerobacillus alkalidiazotrophicus]OIJ18034.1 hypothetical protein BKP45_16265 [Anaerobacillus alkalidiazotrophicus]OIJ19514.1 hypothetical protein BKP45_10550 [Anaerobacillus alkalidiazotrophicus]